MRRCTLCTAHSGGARSAGVDGVSRRVRGLRGGASSAPSDAQGRRGSKPCKYLVAPAPLGVVAPHTCAGVQYPWRDAATSIEAILPEGSISANTVRRGWRETLHLPTFWRGPSDCSQLGTSLALVPRIGPAEGPGPRWASSSPGTSRACRACVVRMGRRRLCRSCTTAPPWRFPRAGASILRGKASAPPVRTRRHR